MKPVILPKRFLLHCFYFSEFDWLLEVPDTGMDNLQCSVRCYSESVKLVTDTKGDNYTTITKRLGNAYNELGVCQMQKALELSQEEGKKSYYSSLAFFSLD